MKDLTSFGERMDRSLNQFRREMEALFDRFFDKSFAPMRFETGEWLPSGRLRCRSDASTRLDVMPD